ncbi:MAG: RraA family protein [Clostridia bacterium]|nr:RraA family protein [Clostridia bacterium]MBR1607528.1 RraA family protein [Clostridia bacterium]
MSITAGNKIIRNFQRPAPALVELFRGIPSSNIGDIMYRLYNMQSDIKAYNPRIPLLGTAFTVKAPEGDNMFFHIAIEMAQPGDIIVVDAGGSSERSLCGEMMFNEAINKGIAGFIVNGCIRDTDCLATLDFPVYATGVTPQGPWKNGPGEINVPVCCGNQVVCPGDILVGDPDGVVVVHPADAAEVAALARDKFEKEQKKLQSYREGLVSKQNEKWIHAAVEQGVTFID